MPISRHQAALDIVIARERLKTWRLVSALSLLLNLALIGWL